MTTTNRQQRYKKGLWAERLAAWYLRFKGYRIVATRYQGPIGEIDLIAKRGGTLVFVEVKARDSDVKGKEAATYTQRRRIEKAAENYLASLTIAPKAVRFDLIVVNGFSLRHYQSAWRVGD